MNVQVRCPNPACGHLADLAEDLLGQPWRCPDCGVDFSPTRETIVDQVVDKWLEMELPEPNAPEDDDSDEWLEMIGYDSQDDEPDSRPSAVLNFLAALVVPSLASVGAVLFAILVFPVNFWRVFFLESLAASFIILLFVSRVFRSPQVGVAEQTRFWQRWAAQARSLPRRARVALGCLACFTAALLVFFVVSLAELVLALVDRFGYPTTYRTLSICLECLAVVPILVLAIRSLLLEGSLRRLFAENAHDSKRLGVMGTILGGLLLLHLLTTTVIWPDFLLHEPMAHWLKGHGGEVLRDHGKSRGPIVAIDGIKSDVILREAASLTTIRSFGLEGQQITNSSLKSLTHLKNLKGLDLKNTSVTNEGLQELANSHALVLLWLENNHVTDEGLKDIAALTNLQGLVLSEPRVTDAGLKELTPLKELKYLNLWQTQVTHAGAANLRRALPDCRISYSGPAVRYSEPGASVVQIGLPIPDKAVEDWIISLSGSAFRDRGQQEHGIIGVTFDLFKSTFSDADLKRLVGLNGLQSLRLGSTMVSDDGLKELAFLKDLTTLSLSSTQVTDAGLKELAFLKDLTTLSLSSTQVTDAGLKELVPLKKLQSLVLDGTKVTDVGMKELSGLKSLRTLCLNHNSEVTDAGLKHLAALENLRVLELRGTEVSDAGVNELRKTLPECSIER